MAASLNLRPKNLNGRLYLDFTNKRLTSIPEQVFDITDLEYLDLSKNKLTTIHESIGRLQKLYRLDADDNKLTSLPQEIASLQNLEELYLQTNTLTELPSEVGELKKLGWLYINDNQLVTLPASICSLRNLKMLVASNNELSELPAGFEQLQNLTKLYVGGNKLTELPSGISSLQHLEAIVASNNKLSTLPEGVERLKNLTELYIDGNQFQELPLGVCSLSNLEVLVVGPNPIRFLPDEIKHLIRLKSLTIISCQFEEFPRPVLKLRSLEQLFAGQEGKFRFRSVPEEIGDLEQLRYLALSNNKLSALPPTMDKLKRLRDVYLYENKFKTFPEVLCSLPKLMVVDIRNNRVSKIPSSLSNLSRLKRLVVAGNPLKYPPTDVCEKGSDDILAFLKDEAEKEEDLKRAFCRLALTVDRLQIKPTARLLGLSDDVIDQIQEEHPDDQMYQMLMTWKERKGSEVTMDILGGTLEELGLYELASALKPEKPGSALKDENDGSSDRKRPTPTARVQPIVRSEETTVKENAVFLSYQWDHQDQVLLLHDRLQERGYGCWMDIKQMGGGDSLYQMMDKGIREAKVVVSCVTPPYVESPNCQDEVALARTLKMPIIPVMLEKTTWPPPGPMSIPFAQLLYINMTKSQDDDPWKGALFEELIRMIEYFVLDSKEESDEYATQECTKLLNQIVELPHNIALTTSPLDQVSQPERVRVNCLGTGEEPRIKDGSVRDGDPTTGAPKHWHVYTGLRQRIFASAKTRQIQQSNMAAALNLRPKKVKGGLQLDLSNKGLASVPDEVFSITDLQYLHLNNNRLSRIPEAIGRLRKLRRFDAFDNLLTSLPQATISLMELEELYVYNNKLTELPDGMDVLQKLERFLVRDNKLEEIPAEICFLYNLKMFDASRNKLSSLPPGIEKMQSLTKLCLSGNQITEVPSGVCGLSNLEELSVGSNPIRRLPDDFSHLDRLKTLDIVDCQFDEFPRQVLQLKALEELYAGQAKGKKFFVLPDEAGGMEHLSLLSLSKNRLRTLPSTMSRLHKLRKISLRHNEFENFPEVLCKLPELEVVDVRDNLIASLPTTLEKAAKLKDLDVSGNPLTYPPRNVCRQGTDAIMAFLKEDAEKENALLRKEFSRLSLLKVDPPQIKAIGRSLGLTDSAIKYIKERFPDDVLYQVLMTWRDLEGAEATLDRLEATLNKLGLSELTETSDQVARHPRVELQTEEMAAVPARTVSGRSSSSKYPGVSVDRRFPIVELDQLDNVSCLGDGGFSSVHRAFHRGWGETVAFKRLLNHRTDKSEQPLLYSEARRLKLASTSPYFISLLGVCLEPHLAIVMPYMENGSLAGLLRDVDVPWALRWGMAHEISLGMTFLHCQDPQILHCDLKAENVLLDDDFHVKISDFGLWKWTDTRVGNETAPPGATRTHVPPEYLTDTSRAPTDKFDVYSFGVLLWDIVKRNPPFPYAANSAVPTDQGPGQGSAPSDQSDLYVVNQLIQACCSQNQEDRPDFKGKKGYEYEINMEFGSALFEFSVEPRLR
ncbi:uncharacterized protein LOC144866412 [Branchiostoma floridae x Branchiostoma japonicum]